MPEISMDDEILWKWELLCNEFEDAKQNYIAIFTPLLKTITEKIADDYPNDIFLQIEQAESAWKNWVAIQTQLRRLAEENN